MKKIVCAIMIAASFVACNKVDNSLYFDNSDNRVFDDATAELDTLSYAVGMNLGLGIQFQFSSVEFDNDMLIASLIEELTTEGIDFEEIDANKELIKRFATERVQPNMLANMIKQNQTSDVLTPVKPIFNEEFTQERVSKMYGRDMAAYITTAAYPLNIHWLRTAMVDASEIESEIVHDSLMRITAMQMRNSLQNYHTRIHPEYVVNASREWLEYVAQQPNVNAMVVDGVDTLYYRVNRAGNGVKPRGLNDTISFSYDLYARNGKLVESHAQRANAVREALEKEKAADTLPNNGRVKARIKQLTDQLNDIENLRIPLSKGLLKGMQYAVQNVSEGGEITVWMPASLAFGARGNRVVHGNDAVVMTITLKSVSYGPTDEELEAMEAENKAKGVVLPKFENGTFAPKNVPPHVGKGAPITPKNPAERKVVVNPVSKQ